MTITSFDLDQLDDSLPLVYPKIIDWDQKEPIDTTTFLDDDAIVHYLCFVNLKKSSTNKFNREYYN